MTKLIVALHGPTAPLTAPAFREAVATAGATRLQVNIDDDAVADALRFGPGEPVTALVSVWTDGDPRTVAAAVAEAAGDPTAHGYRVTEHVRLDPLPTPDGARADVLAQVALLRRPDHLTREEYLAYWLVHHTPVAIRTQATSGYLQNVVEEPLTDGAPALSAIVEEHFPMAGMTDPHAFYGSRGDDAELQRRMTELMTSVARFGADQGLDLVPTSRYHWTL